jgi:hypothetical protein
MEGYVMNRPVDPNGRSLRDRGFDRTFSDIDDSTWCEACREPLVDEDRFTAHWDKVDRRVSLCRDCLGEIFFEVLPLVTGPTPETPSGRGSPLGEPDPWQENAVRALEEANDAMEFLQDRRTIR